jgi:hypothetical protein
LDKAKKFDQEYLVALVIKDQSFERHLDQIKFCEVEYNEENHLMTKYLVAHIIGFVACFLREAYSTKIGWTGVSIKLIEIIGVLIYY